jgi:uncharacterized protein
VSERRYEGFVPGRHLIDAYGAGGFRFADMSHRGSILVLPTGISAWTPSRASDLTPDLFDQVIAQAHRVQVLLVGTGRDLALLPDPIRWLLREAGISSDVMATGAAARTYNIMASENRPVAAALLAVD